MYVVWFTMVEVSYGTSGKKLSWFIVMFEEVSFVLKSETPGVTFVCF